MAKKFDIGDFLKAPEGVSGLNTEQIVLIDVDRIDPDPDNFYSLDGIDALAGNIELIGLQQPLRVRPNGERFTVVSGHRRRAAILLIRDGGSEQFRDGVPCIVEYGEANEAMRKLRLIFANSATRVMTSAEISRQAEEVTALLYELKEKYNIEFPGRMRQHVAEACRISSSKLARLHAIRKNLDSNLLLWFDRGDLNEDAAYKLSQLPQEIQFAVGQELVNGRRKRAPSGVVVDAVLQNLKAMQEAEMKCRAHAGGPDCHHRQERIVLSIFSQYSWDICTPGKCCRDCYRVAACSGACREAKDRVKLDKEVQREKDRERLKEQDAERAANGWRVVKRCKELLPLIEAAGLKDEDTLFPSFRALKVSEVRELAEKGAGNRTFYSDECVNPTGVGDLKAMARKLNVSAAELLGEKAPEPEPEDEIYVSAHKWGAGKPPAPGLYAVRFKVSETAPGELHNFARWDGFQWKAVRSGKIITDLTAAGWFPLPEIEEG